MNYNDFSYCENVISSRETGNNYREISGKFGVVNTPGTDENLLRLVFVLGHGDRVHLKLVPVSGHGAQISAPAPTKGFGAHTT